MRPIQIVWSPKTANTTCFNAQTFNSTGAATAPTTTTTDDGLAHKVTLIAPAQATLAGITFTIVGTDANGAPLTETSLTGPASGATVTSTNHFKSIATIQPSATMGALVVSVGTAAESYAPMIPLEWRSVAAAAITVAVTGTVNFTLKETYGSPFNNAVEALPWVTVTAFSGKIATTSSTVTVGDQAVLLVTNTVTNGATLTLYITQAAGYAL